MKKHMVVDVDDTVCSLIPELVYLCNETSGSQLSVAEWTTYDVWNLYGITTEQYSELLINNKILEQCRPIGKARKTLDICVEQDFTISYLTARAWHPKGKAITKAWFKEWNFPDGKLHVVPLTESKADYTIKNIAATVDIVVDDNAKHIREFVAKKIARKYFLINAPWNKKDRDLDLYRINNISEILQFL